MKHRKWRIAWSVAWGIVAVLLCVSLVSCRQKASPIPNAWIPGPRNVDWKESLAELLPPLADVSQIKLRTFSLVQPLDVAANDWPKLIAALNESVPGASGTTIPVLGILEIHTHDGQLIHLNIYDAGENSVVYHFRPGSKGEFEREYYSSHGKQRILKLLPAMGAMMAGSSTQESLLGFEIILGAALIAVLITVWSRSRFSLRTLLIATTLIAVVLGIIVFVSRAG